MRFTSKLPQRFIYMSGLDNNIFYSCTLILSLLNHFRLITIYLQFDGCLTLLDEWIVGILMTIFFNNITIRKANNYNKKRNYDTVTTEIMQKKKKIEEEQARPMLEI